MAEVQEPDDWVWAKRLVAIVKEVRPDPLGTVNLSQIEWLGPSPSFGPASVRY